MSLRICSGKRNWLIISLSCSLIILGNFGSVQAGNLSALEPALYTAVPVVLTPGSSTERTYQPGQSATLIPVLTLGAGTLKVTLEKSDTRNDFMSVYLLGYPADPPFTPGFAVTPGEIGVSTDLPGGMGIVFILTTVNSRISHESEVTLSLE